MSLCIEPAAADDVLSLKWLDHLQGANLHAVGFLTWAALNEALSRERVLLAYENGEPAGYVIHGSLRETTRILQIVVADDARRIEHGTALVQAVTDRANANHAHRILCHVADDLEANAFWRALGMTKTGERTRAKDGRRKQNRYEALLPGAAIARVARAKKIEEKGLDSLHRLLLRGGIDLGDMVLAGRPPKKHQLPNPYHPHEPWR
jgi:ribosomal protein S18 acetylase RimI-like enzyme